MDTIYRETEFKHGLRCGMEGCEHVFFDGERYYPTPPTPDEEDA